MQQHPETGKSTRKVLSVVRNERGLSLIEIIISVALIGVFVTFSAIYASKGSSLGAEGKISQSIDLIDKSLTERSMNTPLPIQATKAAISTISSIAAYVPADLASYGYKCASGDSPTITTADYGSAAAATAALQKLKDMNLCDSTSAVNASNDKAIDCVLKSQVGKPCS